MIELRGISASYRQGSAKVQPLHDATAVLGGGPVAIMGPSGSGKSTLLRIIAGLQAPDEGYVLIDGIPVKQPTKRSAGDPRVALVHQDYRLVDFLSVADNLQLGAELRSQVVTAAAIEEMLELVGLPGYGNRQPPTLSGGEQQRIAIARSLLTGATVLLADEPTGALDGENTRRITELLVEVAAQRGADLIVATHDIDVARRMHTLFEIHERSLLPAREMVARPTP